MINVLYISHESDAVLGSTLSLANMLHALRDDVRPLVVLRAKGPAFDYLSEQGIECIVVPFKLNLASKHLSRFKFIPRALWDMWIQARCCVRLEDVILQQKIQIIHTNSSVTLFGYQLAHHLAAQKIASVPHVWHLREFIDKDFGLKPFTSWNRLKYFINDSNAIIAITTAIRDHFMTDAGRPYTYVVNDAVCCSSCIGAKPKQNYLLFCGRVIPQKGAETALQIYAEVRQKHPEYKIKYLGEVTDGYRNELQHKAKSLGISESDIEFLGFQKDIRPVMEHATTLLMCSRNEAQGRVTVEAMFYGTPVVGSNAGGTTEIITHGTNGFLFNSPSEAANQVCQLIEQQQLAQQIIENAHQTASTRFSEDVFREQMLRIYHNVLK